MKKEAETKKTTKKAPVKKTTNKATTKKETVKKVEEKSLIEMYNEKVEASEKVKSPDTAKNVALIVMGVIIFIGGIFFVSEFVTKDVETKGTAGESNTTQETSSDSENPLLESGQKLDENKMKDLHKITWDEYMDLYEGDEPTVIFLGSSSCGWCTYQQPILKNVLYMYDDIDVPYLDLTTITSDNYSTLVEQTEQAEGIGTPTFISVSNKKVNLFESGARGTSDLIDLLENAGIIKK